MFIEVQYLSTFCIDKIIGHEFFLLETVFSLNPPKWISTIINETRVIVPL